MSSVSFVDDFTHIIDGKKVVSPTTAGILNPSTEKVFAHVPVATDEQLEEAIDTAERAFPAWAAKPWEERQEVMNTLAALLDKHAGQLAELLMKEVGKDRATAAFEMSGASQWLRDVAQQKLQEDIISNEGGRVCKIRFNPYGVCAGIIPFNFPVAIAVTKASQALLAGNCLILKAPPTAPCALLKFVELAQTVLPSGVLSVLYGGNDLGQWIVKHPRITRVSVTGSTAAGKAVMREAASELKRLTLELGGNDPAIVLDDADPKEVAQSLFIGSTMNAGQVCICMKRLYIHEKIYDAVKEELVALAKTAKIGNPFDPDITIGPAQNKGQYQKVRELLADCKEKGYKIAFAGEDRPTGDKGYFTPLTIIDNPPDDSRIVREEQFGLIVPLLKWRDDAEVVRRANDTEYGLTSSVWGRDAERLRRIAEQLSSGVVWINEWASASAHTAFVGTKHSGLGVEGSKYGLLSWTSPQSLVYNGGKSVA